MRNRGHLMIFLDTCYFENLMNTGEPNHRISLEIQDYINDSNELTVINTTVLVETLNRSVKTNTFAERMYRALKSRHCIVPLNKNDYLESLEINRWFGNSINYSDCTIIHTMMEMNITDIVTFDSDFEKVNGLNIISAI